MQPLNDSFFAELVSLPKAELHVHLEGSVEPATAVELGRRYGGGFDEAAVAARYATRDFAAFIEAYKWITSYLRDPADYALAVSRLAERLLAQSVVYAEVTLSVGVMLLRRQDVAANFRAIRDAAAPFEPRGLRIQWIFDTVRQFGPAAAREVANHAIAMRNDGVIAYGMGGDELSVPASDFRAVYDQIAQEGLHRLVHAGEIGGPDSIRDAVEMLGAERIGHGIAAARDPQLVSLLAERSIHLEICPTSNLCTGALARQFPPTETLPDLSRHPLPELLRSGVPLSLSTDDPAMFDTSLHREYMSLGTMGLKPEEVLRVAENAFSGAFLPPLEKAALIKRFHDGAAALV